MKKRLSKNFTEKNTVIFNNDDKILMSIFKKTKFKTHTYGIKNLDHTFISKIILYIIKPQMILSFILMI